ncbi:FAD-dependent oxidoreductase [Micromonospora sp. M12]
MRYDVVVIGSGFGGSVTALRLAEKGYSVGVLEAGRRFADDEFPQTSWRARRFLWAPRLGCYGIQRLTLLRPADRRSGGGVLVLSGAGVGGGSLVYANTLYEPLPAFYADPQWRDITDWRDELARHYDQAKRMLGVTAYPWTPVRTGRCARWPRRWGGAHLPRHPGRRAHRPSRPAGRRPVLRWRRPERTGCLHCGSCMTGCRHGAKNTLVKNYLWLAERLGVTVHPLTTVTAVRPAAEGGYEVHTERTGNWLCRGGRSCTPTRWSRRGRARHPTAAARHAGGRRAPGLSPRLGELTRTNSEAILGASVPRQRARSERLDYTEGWRSPARSTPTRRPTSSRSATGGLQRHGAAPVPAGRRRPAPGAALAGQHRAAAPAGRADAVRPRVVGTDGDRPGHAVRGQLADHPLETRCARPTAGHRPGPRHAQPDLDPGRQHSGPPARRRDRRHPGGSLTEPFDIPMTAHILGGTVIGATSRRGDRPWHRVYGHAGLHVVDGAAVSANLGVNPP